MTKILIGIPMFQAMYARPLARFLEMAVCAGNQLHGKAEVSVRVVEREAADNAMNILADIVVQHDFDGLVMADDDCLPPMDAIPRLVAHLEAGLDFVSGVGYMRGYPHTTTIGQYIKEGISAVQTPYGVEWRGFRWLDNLDHAPPLIEPDFCGVPIAIASRKCFTATKPPYFSNWLDGKRCTHDVYFCKKIKDAGLKVHVDTTMRCGHLADPAIIDESSRRVARLVGHELIKAQHPQVA